MKLSEKFIRTTVVVAALTGVAGCASGASPSPGDASSSADYTAQIPAPVHNIGVCVDPSLSNDQSMITAGLDQTAAVIRDLPTPDPAAKGARPPVTETNLVVRQVSSSPVSSPADQLLSAHVPGVPGLVEPPDAADFESFASRNDLWTAAERAATDAQAAAAAAREQLLQDLSSVRPVQGGSEIAGCVTSLRDSFPVGADVVEVVISDLEQTGQPQLRGDYSHVTLVVAHACTDVQRCGETEAEWRSVLSEMHVVSAEFVSINQLESELLKILEVPS